MEMIRLFGDFSEIYTKTKDARKKQLLQTLPLSMPVSHYHLSPLIFGVEPLLNRDYDCPIQILRLATTTKWPDSLLWSLRGDAHFAPGDNPVVHMF